MTFRTYSRFRLEGNAVTHYGRVCNGNHVEILCQGDWPLFLRSKVRWTEASVDCMTCLVVVGRVS